MKRREFIGLLGSAATWPIAARAQQTGKVHRVALVFSTSAISEMAGPDPINPGAKVFVHTLRELGYVEGRNLVLERRSAEGRFERFPEIMRELLSVNVDVIVTVTNPMTRAAKEATQTVPIVMLSNNVVEEGLVRSLARPGGNITGVTAITSMEIFQKWVQLLKELLPRITRVAHLQHRAEMAMGWEQSAEVAARQVGVQVLLAEHTPTNYADAFAFIVRERIDAVTVATSAANFGNRHLIIEFMAKNRLPAIYPTRAYVDAGGLIAYGADTVALIGRLAGYVDRILKGAKPADLPVEQPTKFLLTINLKTAKALGLTVPPLLLARADEVIE